MQPLEQLDQEEILQTIREVARNNLPIRLTVRERNRWVSLQSEFIGMLGGFLLIHDPKCTNPDDHVKLAPETKVGVCFKHRQRKYMFSTQIHSEEFSSAASGAPLRLLTLTHPDSVLRSCLREHERASVPSQEKVRIEFWPGGVRAEPSQESPEIPVWHGQVEDLSIGGLLCRAHRDAYDFLEIGDILGVRMIFKADGRLVEADARLRHMCPEGKDKALFGLRFMGLETSQNGHRDLQFLSAKVHQYLQK